MALGMTQAKRPIGISISLFGRETTAENLAEARAAGVEYVEVTLNNFWRFAPENECYPRAFRTLKLIEESGLKVWSCHLPFSRKLDISVTDPALREENVRIMSRMIELAGIFSPQCLVLHPSSEPIADDEREARMKCAINSIGLLSLEARKIGAVLCIEDLPRTCLGRNSEEILRLIADYPEVMVCFDTNHLLTEDQSVFIERVGSRIATIHISDYDRTDERHWLPGEGVIDWSAFYRGMLSTGYRGVWMHEVRKGEKATCENIVKACNEHIFGRKQK